jgi:hypothetical protein
MVKMDKYLHFPICLDGIVFKYAVRDKDNLT